MRPLPSAMAAVTLLVVLAPRAPGQDSGTAGSSALTPFSIQVVPGITVPLGESARYFTVGGSLEVVGEYAPPALGPFSMRAGLGFDLAPVQADVSLSILHAEAGAGLRIAPLPWLTLTAYGSAGYYVGLMNSASRFDTGSDPVLSAGAGVFIRVTPGLSVGLGSSYRYYHALYGGLQAFLGAAFRLGGAGAAAASGGTARPQPLLADALQVTAVELGDVFPVFYRYYDEHPLGAATVENVTDAALTDVRISFTLNKYMDVPKLCASLGTLEPRQSARVDVTALFNDGLLDITAETKIAAEVVLSYKRKGEMLEQRSPVAIRIQNRNAMTWDDDRKAAAFVSLMDPLVTTFSKNVAAMVAGKGSKAVNERLQLAMAIHETLCLYGLAYVVDPTTPHSETSQDRRTLDFLQFPRETLEYRGGDCDDLAILYCALLESVGIETAFITIPGHIFMAFSLDLAPDLAKRTYQSIDDLIFSDEGTWVPLEITQREGGFLKAWETGAEEWRENRLREQARLYPLHAAWESFAPVGLNFPRTGSSLVLPSPETVQAAFLQQVVDFIDREIYPQVSKIQAEMKRGGETPKLNNQLGVLYGRFGLYDRAVREFEKAIAREDFMPALLNLGNIAFLNGDMERALGFYQRAGAREPENPRVLLGVARANHELQNFGVAAKTFARLKGLDPVLAAEYAYLESKGEESTRAANALRLKGTVTWSE